MSASEEVTPILIPIPGNCYKQFYSIGIPVCMYENSGEESTLFLADTHG